MAPLPTSGENRAVGHRDADGAVVEQLERAEEEECPGGVRAVARGHLLWGEEETFESRCGVGVRLVKVGAHPG